MKNENTTAAEKETIFRFRQIAVPVKTWGKYRGNKIIADVLGYKRGEINEREFEIQNALGNGLNSLIISPEDYHSARPASHADLFHAGFGLDYYGAKKLEN